MSQGLVGCPIFTCACGFSHPCIFHADCKKVNKGGLLTWLKPGCWDVAHSISLPIKLACQRQLKAVLQPQLERDNDTSLIALVPWACSDGYHRLWPAHSWRLCCHHQPDRCPTALQLWNFGRQSAGRSIQCDQLRVAGSLQYLNIKLHGHP